MNKRVFYFFLVLIGFLALVSSQNYSTPSVNDPFTLPSSLALILLILFGINNPAPLSSIVIHLASWLLAFIFIFNMSAFVPYFKKVIVRLPVSLIVTTLISVSGGFTLFVDSLQSLNLLILKITGVKSLTVGFIIVFVLVFAILYLIVYFSKKFFFSSLLQKTESDATSAGLRIGALTKMFNPDNKN